MLSTLNNCLLRKCHKNTGKRHRLNTMTWKPRRVQRGQSPWVLFIKWWIAALDKREMCYFWYDHLLTIVFAEWAQFGHILIQAHGITGFPSFFKKNCSQSSFLLVRSFTDNSVCWMSTVWPCTYLITWSCRLSCFYYYFFVGKVPFPMMWLFERRFQIYVLQNL
jgi:hypothetical protein